MRSEAVILKETKAIFERCFPPAKESQRKERDITLPHWTIRLIEENRELRMRLKKETT